MKTFKQLAVLAVLSALLISCCDCPSGAPDPQHIISENDAYQLQQTYFNNQHKYITIGVEGQYQNGEPDNVGVIVKDIDDLQKYLINIKKVLKINQYAPLEYVSETLRRMIINNRKLIFIDQLRKDITKDAIKNKSFEIY